MLPPAAVQQALNVIGGMIMKNHWQNIALRLFTTVVTEKFTQFSQ